MIRTFAQLTGKLVLLQQEVEYAALYYKPLENIKDIQLKSHHGNFNSFMTIPLHVYPIIRRSPIRSFCDLDFNL